MTDNTGVQPRDKNQNLIPSNYELSLMKAITIDVQWVFTANQLNNRKYTLLQTEFKSKNLDSIDQILKLDQNRFGSRI